MQNERCSFHNQGAFFVGTLLLPSKLTETQVSNIFPYLKQLDTDLEQTSARLLTAETTFFSEASEPSEAWLILSQLVIPAHAGIPMLSTPTEDSGLLLRGIPACAGMTGLVSVDTYVLGRHFTSQTPWTDVGYYVAAASSSDIGAMGGTFRKIWIDVVADPQRLQNFSEAEFRQGLGAFLKAVAAELVQLRIHAEADFPGLAIQAVVSGDVTPTALTPLAGLKAGMDIFVVGKLGGAAARGYSIDRSEILENVRARKHSVELRIADCRLQNEKSNQCDKVATTNPQSAICNLQLCATDTSDGLAKALLNLHKFRIDENLAIEIDEAALRQCLADGASLDDGLYGGDDYALALALPNTKYQIPNARLIGKTISSSNPGIYLISDQKRQMIDRSKW